MNKIVFLLLQFCLLLNMAYAMEVTVIGQGVDRDAAMNDAKRNAVEQVVGTYISSQSMMKNANVLLDEIYSKSVGFVTNINVLEEGKRKDFYSIKAKVNVNNNPNSELRNKIEMIRFLGDPRICAIVTYYADNDNEKREKYPIICEGAMNEKLNLLGFSHVVSADVIFQRRGMERYMAADKQLLFPQNDLDYYIIGRLDVHTGNIMLPKYKDITNDNTGFQNKTDLVKSDAELDVEIIKADTGEVIQSYRVEAGSIKNTNNFTENEAIKALGKLAAEKLKSGFSRKAAKVDGEMQIVVFTGSYDNVMKFNKELRELSGIRNITIKNFTNGKGIISINTDLKAQTVYRMLREQSKLKMTMEKANLDSLEILVE